MNPSMFVCVGDIWSNETTWEQLSSSNSNSNQNGKEWTHNLTIFGNDDNQVDSSSLCTFLQRTNKLIVDAHGRIL